MRHEFVRNLEILPIYCREEEEGSKLKDSDDGKRQPGYCLIYRGVWKDR